MKSAIIAGGNGLIGRALVRELHSARIPVLILGSSKEIHSSIKKLIKPEIHYHRIERMTNWHYEAVQAIKSNLVLRDPVFFNLAWRGNERLVDGGIDDQLKNVGLSCLLVKLAKEIGAKKYVSTGSMEEVILERMLENEKWLEKNNTTEPNWYALAKISARMQSAFEAYQQKIDFCYTNISIVIDKSLQTGKYVEEMLKGVLLEPKIPKPNNKELCNISSSEEIARQLFAIGELGVNKSSYVLGTGEAASLFNQFVRFSRLVHQEGIADQAESYSEVGVLSIDDFSVGDLIKDTGYKPKESTDALFREIAGRT